MAKAAFNKKRALFEYIFALRNLCCERGQEHSQWGGSGVSTGAQQGPSGGKIIFFKLTKINFFGAKNYNFLDK